ncbi:MAG: bifunctional DNA primase/polymerase [Alkalispirochaeta sp.]
MSTTKNNPAGEHDGATQAEQTFTDVDTTVTDFPYVVNSPMQQFADAIHAAGSDRVALAVAFASAGFRVFPQDRSKRGIKGFPELATTDPEQIRTWAKTFSRHNFAGYLPGGWAVLDIDIKGDADGYESLGKLSEDDETPTLTVRSGSGGEHRFYLTEAHAKSGDLNGFPGLEIKAGETASGWITLPGAVYADGREYRVTHALPPAKAPAWLETVTTKGSASPASSTVPVNGSIPRSERNRTLTSLAGTMQRRGMGQESILSALMAENAAKCDPPLPDDEVRDIARSVTRYEPDDRHKTTSSEHADTGKKSQATIIVEQVLASGVVLFHTGEEECYATIEQDNTRRTVRLRSSAFKKFLARLFYLSVKAAPSTNGVNDALAVLEGEALFNSPEHAVYHRVAPGGDADWWIDIGDADYSAVHITPGSWEVVQNPPVRFVRPVGMRALPMPNANGSIDDLSPFVNVQPTDENGNPSDDWILLIAWMTAALRPFGPYPILVLLGEQGSAKSATMTSTCDIVDPTEADRQTMPRDEQALFVWAAHCRVLRIDNVSSVQGWFSDALCRLATGGGALYRKLYTDNEASLFKASRPIAVNGISDFIYRPDLLDRSILLYLPTIDEDHRQDEHSMHTAFDAAAPAIFGGLLNLLATAAEHHPIETDHLPRMADFARFSLAVERAAGWPEGSFLAAYQRNQDSGAATVLEGSTIGMAIKSLIDTRYSLTVFEDTPSELLDLLNSTVDAETHHSKHWPDNPKSLGSAIRRVAPLLRNAGYYVDTDQREGHTGRRLVRLGIHEEVPF